MLPVRFDEFSSPHDFFRQHYEVHISWYPSPNRNAEVHVFAEPRAMLTPDDRFDLRALVF